MAAPLTGMKSGIALLEDPHFPGDDDAALRLFNRIADRISQDYAVPRSTAGDALDQALIFVAVAGQKRDLMLSPSPLVDWAWDTFILYTPYYHAFCERFGGYVHHVPNDAPELLITSSRKLHSPYETASVLREAGYHVLDELWPRDAMARAKANCTSCYNGGHEGDLDDVG
ncbi:hypothetical protein OG320_19825 [Microbispora sp. NBC_01189]|uniref:hypothetical protein n=1 Tax=Microbispora sp. NBC_01189 TaxID=2903583 RepID=UPI002E135745|nr:hypothetical protein OG320_19825 [Microbispora sp. NBC_01189]